MFITGAGNPGNDKDSEEVNEAALEIRELIELHMNAAVQHEEAAKHHREAARNQSKQNTEEAKQNALRALEHSERAALHESQKRPLAGKQP
jgi:hypothetical protein